MSPSPSRDELLKLDVSRFSGEGALPGFLPLYDGMPIIMRNKNISTELGVANGSQGILRKFKTQTCPSNYTYGTYAVVEFPRSQVALSDLPSKYFPLEPITWRFTYNIDMDPSENCINCTKCNALRAQWGFQPAFACTGHSAQGKKHSLKFFANCTKVDLEPMLLPLDQIPVKD